MWGIFVDGMKSQIVMSVDGDEIRSIASTQEGDDWVSSWQLKQEERKRIKYNMAVYFLEIVAILKFTLWQTKRSQSRSAGIGVKWQERDFMVSTEQVYVVILGGHFRSKPPYWIVSFS